MAASPQNDPLIGQILSERYRVLERIGRGGFGAVYKVQHIRLDKALALKVLFDRSGENPRMIKRFEREARAACRIGHENIVEITDFARFGDHGYYFVMEHLEGETLGRRIKRIGPLSPERIVHVGSQIADALAATHGKGIIHRDLKPDNVFLIRRKADPDFVKVLDFGIAAMMEPGEHLGALTDHGAMLGTPAYMSPEQATGLQATAQSDVYSLGILLYEMATGSVPFRDQNAMSVLEMHRARDPLPPRQARPDLPIPESMEAIILRALRKSPSQRYATMREVFNDLQASLPEVGDTILTSVDTTDAPRRDLDSEREPIEWLEAEEALVLLDPTGPIDRPPAQKESQRPRPTLSETPAVPLMNALALAATSRAPSTGTAPVPLLRRSASPPPQAVVAAPPQSSASPSAPGASPWEPRPGDDFDPTFVRPPPRIAAERPTEPAIAVAIPLPTTGPTLIPVLAVLERKPSGTYQIAAPIQPWTHRPVALVGIGFVATLILYVALTTLADRFTADQSSVDPTTVAGPIALPGLPTPIAPEPPAATVDADPPVQGPDRMPGTLPAAPAEAPAPYSGPSTPPRDVDLAESADRRAPEPVPEPPGSPGAEPEERRLRSGVALTRMEVFFHFDSTPPGATVKQGERFLVTTPGDYPMATTTEKARLSFELDGYKTEVREVRLDADQTLSVKFRKKGREGGSGGGPGSGYDKW